MLPSAVQFSSPRCTQTWRHQSIQPQHGGGHLWRHPWWPLGVANKRQRRSDSDLQIYWSHLKCNPSNTCAAFHQIQLTACSPGSSTTARLLVTVYFVFGACQLLLCRFNFLSNMLSVGWGKRLWNDLFSVKRDIKTNHCFLDRSQWFIFVWLDQATPTRRITGHFCLHCFCRPSWYPVIAKGTHKQYKSILSTFPLNG